VTSEGLGHDPLPIVCQCDVADHRERAREILGESGETIFPTRRHHHCGPGRVEHPSEARAQTGRCSGHERDAAVESKLGQRINRNLGGHGEDVTTGSELIPIL
jgi:hypothetical protein